MRASSSVLALALAGCASVVPPHVVAERGAPHPDWRGVELPTSGRPPAVQGGGLLVTADGRHALVSDIDRDIVIVVDLMRGLRVASYVALRAGDQPGRLVEDSSGIVHVVLRGGGSIVSIDAESGLPIARRAVCSAPRGIDWDAAEGRLLVACAGGALRSIAGDEVRTVSELGPDLRDVVIDHGGGIYVTRFRAAELIDASTGRGQTAAQAYLGSPTRLTGQGLSAYDATVAWRATAKSSRGIWMAHERERDDALVQPFFHYYGGAAPAVMPQISSIENGRWSEPIALAHAVLPVDIAESRDGRLAVACGAQPLVELIDRPSCQRTALPTSGRAVGVAWVGDLLLVYQRSPSMLRLFDPDSSSLISAIALGDHRTDPGFEVFHQRTVSGAACASCHPEAGDDGRVWNFDGSLRRTPTLAGGLLATAPFHWNGEHDRMTDLMRDVFSLRMGGDVLEAQTVHQLESWLDGQALVRAAPTALAGSAERGRQLFEDARTACATCHRGPLFTDNATHDVGTGGAFQTPSLRGLVGRAPYFHDGRVHTIEDRFASGHTPGHGSLDGLQPADVRDLVAYLETL